MRQKEHKPSLYAGIFFLTCGTLIFEIALIRVFSVAQWYHFAFLVVSIAMLGLGAAGSFLTIFTKWQQRVSLNQLSNLAFFFAIGVVVSYFLTNNIPFDQQKITWDVFQFIYLLLYYCILAIPPFFTGLILASVYTKYSQHIGKLYFVDLFGAAIGSVVVLKVSSLSSGLGGIGTAAFCGFLSSFLFSPRLRRGLTNLVFVSLLGGLWIIKPSFISLNMSEYKALPQLLFPPDSKILRTEWTPLARIDFVQSPLVHFAPGLSLRSYASLPTQLGVVIDGGNLNAVTMFDGNPASLTFVDNLPSAMPYHLSEITSVLVLEPFGGLELLTALYFGAPNIESAGIYNRISKIVAEDFSGFSGGLFCNFQIKMNTISPRAFLKQTKQKYDLICLPISDSFGAAGTGIYGPSEDYLFTRESFTECFQNLSENGWLYVACYLLPPLRQELRLISLAVSALETTGKQNPEAHLIAIRTLETFSLLVKPGQIKANEIDVLKKFCNGRGFDLVYYPGIESKELNRFNRFDKPIVHEAFMAIMKNSTREKFYKNYLYDVRPTSDNRPFFGHFFRRDKLREEYESMGHKWTAFFEGGYLVVALFFQACLVSLVFIVLPLILGKHRSGAVRSRKGIGAILSYFFSIGLAYMLIEIVLIQRFVLFLDHPLYAASAVIGSLLISSACGSYISRKFNPGLLWNIHRHFLVLCLLLAFFMVFLSRILAAWIGHDLIERYLFAIFLIAIPGFLMGFPFPVGIRKLGSTGEHVVPWAYCANGSASVIGSSLAVLLALEWGFSWVMAVAISFYLIASLSGLRWITRST